MLTFEVTSIMVEAPPSTEDGLPVAPRFFVRAEDDSGRRFDHFAMFETGEEAEKLLAKIEFHYGAAMIEDLNKDYWTEAEARYGSEAWGDFDVDDIPFDFNDMH